MGRIFYRYDCTSRYMYVTDNMMFCLFVCFFVRPSFVLLFNTADDDPRVQEIQYNNFMICLLLHYMNNDGYIQ
jgi:hypothetical protein